jgi:hypothetical protein
MFARGGAVQRFQAGGPAMPMQGDPMGAAPMGAAPMGAAPMQGTPVPGVPNQAQLEQMPMEEVMAAAQQSGIDPAQLEQMLGGMAGQFEGLDQAEDYEQVMNAMRGNQAPISARREELAGLVGPEDASATPESVLTLVQPVMMMAGVDQGIGGLAAEEMNTPVEGPMAEGIMSMAMPQAAPPMPPGPPMPQGAPPMPGMGGPAPVNFRFGGPVVAMQEGGEPGNRLAELFGQQRDVYRSLINPADQQAEMDRQRNMTQAQMLFDVANTALAFSAPGSRSGMSPAERLAEAAQQTQFFDRISQRTGAFEQSRQEQAKEGRALDLAALQSASGLQAAEFEASLRPAAAEAEVKGIPLSIFREYSPEEQRQIVLGVGEQKPTVLAENAIAIDSEGNTIADNTRTAQEQTFTLAPGQKVFGRDGNIIAENKTEDNKTHTLAEGQILVDSEGNTIVEYKKQPESEILILNGQIVAVNPRTNVATPIWGKEKLAPAEYRVIRDNSNGMTTTIDISLASGRAAIDAANAANEEAGTTRFTVRTVPSDTTPEAKAFQINNNETVLSYDGGRTYASRDGQIKSMPSEGVVPLSDTIAYEVMRAEQIRAVAGNKLREFDERLGLTMTGGDRDNPRPLNLNEVGLVRDAMQAARGGTGPWSGIGALVDNVVGGMIPNDAIRMYFQDNQENRQFLRGITILARSAFVNNPRYPVAEMERIAPLFPDPDAFFKNPEAEAQKLIEIKALAMSQYYNNLTALNQGILDAATKQAVMSQNFEIERLLSLLQTVPDGTNEDGADEDALNSLRSTRSEGVQ